MMTKEILFLCLLAGNACLVFSASSFDSLFTALDSNTDKIKEGLSCTKNDTDSTVFMFEFHTVETDQAEWFLNYTAFSFLITEAIDTQNKTEANQTGCGVEEYGDNLELWRAKFPVTIADANPPCGGKKDGTMFTFAIRVQIHPSFDSRADAIFLASCNTSDLTQTTLNIQRANPLQVGDIAIVHKSVSYLTTIDLIEGGNTLDWANDVLITGPIDLGTPFRIRIGFHIRSPADNRTDFDKNGFGPIAMYPHKCTFSRDPSQEIDTNDPDTLLSSQDIIDDGCGTGAYAAFNLKGVHGFEARKSPTLDGDNWYEKSPNFLYNPKDISAVAFMGSKVQVGATAYRKTNITCYLKPCKSFSDSRCFGNGTEGQGYKDCSGARRRRDTADEVEDFYDGDEDLPTEVSTILTIRLNPDAVSDRITDEPCFETTTFYALTAVLVVLLVAVLIIAAFLACKLRGVMRDIDSSQGSRTGIHNKGYYQ